MTEYLRNGKLLTLMLGLDMIEGDYEDPGQLELNWLYDRAELTADRLVVIGRGRLLAETTVAELAAGADSLEDAFFRITSQTTDYQGTGAS